MTTDPASTTGPAQEVLDCRGMRCPLPVVEVARRVQQLSAGQVLAVVADDPAAAADIPAWCRLRGHSYLGTGDAVEGAPTYLVRCEGVRVHP